MHSCSKACACGIAVVWVIVYVFFKAYPCTYKPLLALYASILTSLSARCSWGPLWFIITFSSDLWAVIKHKSSTSTLTPQAYSRHDVLTAFHSAMRLSHGRGRKKQVSKVWKFVIVEKTLWKRLREVFVRIARNFICSMNCKRVCFMSLFDLFPRVALGSSFVEEEWLPKFWNSRGKKEKRVHESPNLQSRHQFFASLYLTIPCKSFSVFKYPILRILNKTRKEYNIWCLSLPSGA